MLISPTGRGRVPSVWEVPFSVEWSVVVLPPGALSLGLTRLYEILRNPATLLLKRLFPSCKRANAMKASRKTRESRYLGTHPPIPCSVSVCNDVTYEMLGLSQMSTHPRWAKSVSQFFKRWTGLLTCCGRHPWSVLDFKDMLWMMCRIQLCFFFFFK